LVRFVIIWLLASEIYKNQVLISLGLDLLVDLFGFRDIVGYWDFDIGDSVDISEIEFDDRT